MTAVLSTIIENPRDWADEAVLLMNEPLRLMFTRVRSGLSYGENLIDLDAYEWLKEFFDFFHDIGFPIATAHIEGVERIYLPWLQAPGSTKRMVDETSAGFMSALRELSSYGEGYGSPQNARVNKVFADKTMKDVVTRIESLLTRADVYLNVQDEAFPNLLRAGFSKEEESKVFVRLLKSYGSKRVKLISPLIYDALTKWKGEEAAKKWKEGLPMSIKFVFWRGGDPQYERVHKGYMVRIKGMEPDEFDPEKYNGRLSMRVLTLGRHLSQSSKELYKALTTPEDEEEVMVPTKQPRVRSMRITNPLKSIGTLSDGSDGKFKTRIKSIRIKNPLRKSSTHTHT